jgi:hypothetical protein
LKFLGCIADFLFDDAAATTKQTTNRTRNTRLSHPKIDPKITREEPTRLASFDQHKPTQANTSQHKQTQANCKTTKLKTETN